MLRILFFLIFLAFKSLSQESIGARAFAVKSFVAVANDVWAVFYNPAGIADLKSREISFSYIPAQFGLTQLSEKGAVYYEPSLPVKFGIGIKSFGFELYRENVLKITIARGFGAFNLGLNLNYTFISIKNYGSAGAFSADFGFVSKPAKFLKFGFVVKNLISGKIGEAQERLPKEIDLGIALMPYSNLIVSMGVYKELTFRECVRYGVEYNIVDFVSVRFGLSNYPVRYSGGVGIKLSRFQLDYGIDNHQLLGLTHQITLTVKFGKEG